MLRNKNKVKILEAENRQLKEMVSRFSVEELNSTREKLLSELENLKELKTQYEQLIVEVQATKNIYEQRLKDLIQSI